MPNVSEKDDNEILELLRNGSDQDRSRAFSWLVDKYSKRLYWLARGIVASHVDADDVVQNVFIKIWRDIHNFRSDSILYTWMYRITVNESLSLMRGRKSRYSVMADDMILQSYVDSEAMYDGDQIEKALMRATLRLPAKQRAVFNMRYFQEISYADMSEIMGTSQGALKASYHHAVKKIEEWIEQELDS